MVNLGFIGLGIMGKPMAKQVERQVHVISKQVKRMEADGLIMRIKNTHKKNILRLELTKKGSELISVADKSKSIKEIFSFLSEENRDSLESILKQILVEVEKYAPGEHHDRRDFRLT